MGINLLSLASSAAPANGAGGALLSAGTGGDLAAGLLQSGAASGNFAADLASLLAAVQQEASGTSNPLAQSSNAASGNAGTVSTAELSMLLQGSQAKSPISAKGVGESSETSDPLQMLLGKRSASMAREGRELSGAEQSKTNAELAAQALAMAGTATESAAVDTAAATASSGVNIWQRSGAKPTQEMQGKEDAKRGESSDSIAGGDASLLAGLVAAQSAAAAQQKQLVQPEGSAALGGSALGLPSGTNLAATDGSLLPAAQLGAANESANLAATVVGEGAGSSDFSNLMQSQLQANSAGTVAHAPVQNANATLSSRDVPTHFGQPAWGEAVGEQVVWMAKNDQHSAQLTLNPPQLGPVQVTLSMNGDQVTASFVSPHAEVRQALEDSLPKLREMFSGAGINLGDANVGSQQQNPQSRESFFASANGNGGGGGGVRSEGENAILRPDVAQQPVTTMTQPITGRGLVNLYA